jgi:hypothetical protein
MSFLDVMKKAAADASAMVTVLAQIHLKML